MFPVLFILTAIIIVLIAELYLTNDEHSVFICGVGLILVTGGMHIQWQNSQGLKNPHGGYLMKTTERVHFRLINMPCCGHMFCNVNARWPSYCINCGQRVFPDVKACAIISDDEAFLTYDTEKQP